MFGTPTSSGAYNQPAYALAEREQPLNIKVKLVAAGYSHTVFFDSTGNVFAAGSGISGQLGIIGSNGNAETTCVVPRPVCLPPNVRVIDIACGDHHSAALTDEGKLLAWGLNKTNACGQLHINDHLNASQYAYNADEDKTTIPLEVFQPTESRAFSRMEKRALGLSAGSDTTIVIVKKSVE